MTWLRASVVAVLHVQHLLQVGELATVIEGNQKTCTDDDYYTKEGYVRKSRRLVLLHLSTILFVNLITVLSGESILANATSHRIALKVLIRTRTHVDAVITKEAIRACFRTQETNVTLNEERISKL